MEAKSRRHAGVLGHPGAQKAKEAFRLDVRQLLHDALGKPVNDPYAIFIDANMPPDFALERQDEWLADVERAIALHDHGFNDVGIRTGSLFNVLAVTNVPLHYGAPGGQLPTPLVYRVVPAVAQRPMRYPAVLLQIERSLGQLTNIPQKFPW